MTGSATAEPGTLRADCVADPAGGLAFDLASDGADELVLRRRGGTGPSDELRLPLTPAGGGRLRAVLPGTLELAEGHWDVCAGDRPVGAGIRDVRALVDRAPGRGRVIARVPYPAADGRLAVRSWVRAPHAEAGDIGVAGGACTVGGVVYGTGVGAGATAEARLGDTVHRVPVTGGRGTFAFTLPYDTLAGRSVGAQQLWTLWLRPDEGAEPVRISRILDDLWDRRAVFVYPVHQGEGYRAAPCYDAANDLCVRLTP